MPTPYPTWTEAVHHDGSMVSDGYPSLNDVVSVRLRTPHNAPGLRWVFLRTAPDGEQHFEQMRVVEEDAVSAFYEAEIPMRNRLMTYRFKLLTDTGAYFYTGRGIARADAPDTFDFKLLADFEALEWVHSSVFYQIFPDRFYNGDPSLNPTEGVPFNHPPFEPFKTQMRDWDAPPLQFHEGGNVDFYGGDLPGIVQKLDYLDDLGVNALYLNPIFTSPSNHKYNIRDFYSVDSAFGGNDALAMLRKTLSARNMHYVLDLTPNHLGNENPWFTDAQANADAPTFDYFTFYDHPHNYECWLGIRTLPKLDYRSEALRDHMYRDAGSVMRFWLKPPFEADGWRLDVWNMTAIQGGVNVQHDVGNGMREAVKGTNPQAYLFGEHFFDSTPSLQGDEMDGTMNYQGFSFPLWRWLAGHDLGAWNAEPQPYSDTFPIPAEVMVEQMVAFMGAVPWAIARMAFNQLGSHDTPRILTVVNEDKALAKLGASILMTFPGVPCVYYGDEVGMMGGRDPANRGGMIWDETRQNQSLQDHYKSLIKLRRTHPALIDGGFQVLLADGELLAYQRMTTAETLILVGNRGEALDSVQVPVWRGGIADGTTFTAIDSGELYTVVDGRLTFAKLPHGGNIILTASR
ncbi:MAG: alpha amylase N-terminal ig-like domain-containing protein [Chloroflexota bacterium]